MTSSIPIMRLLLRRAFRNARAVLCAMVLVANAPPVAAQRLGLSADSVESLVAGLAPDAQAGARRFLEGNDSIARLTLRTFRFDPAAGPLLLLILERDPSPQIRQSLIASMPYYSDYWSNVPGIVPALVDRIRRDPSVNVVASATEAVRVLALATSELPEAVRQRLSVARASGDTTLARLLLEEDENLVHAMQPVAAPPFVRNAPPPFPAVPSDQNIRFSVFGDYGVAHLPNMRGHQLDIARALRNYHGQNALDFGITTGDNFYPTSFPSPTDPSWQVTWADLYDPLGIPFYISLGNHDWGEPSGPLAEYIYARTSPSFRLPAFYYSFTAGPAQFFAINTNELTERQLAWLRDELSRSTAKWKFVYGHFPVYEQTNYTVEPQQAKVLPILREYGVDAYFAGHHHSMQHWVVDGIDYIVAGSGGAPNYSLDEEPASTTGRRFAESAPGFAVVEAEESVFRLRFIGRDGAILYEYERWK